MSTQRPFCPAGQALVDWLAAHDESQTAFALRVGVARSVLWRWLVGEQTPHVDSAAAIERLTGIAASMWASDADLRPPLLPAAAEEG